MHYLNFESNTNTPVNKYMSGKYQVGENKLENFSIPVDVLSMGRGNAVVKPLQDLNLPWKGNYNDEHIERLYSSQSIVVPIETVSTDSPKYQIPEFVKPDEYTLSPKRASEIVERLIDTIILENENTNDRIEECKKYGFENEEITDLHIVTEKQMNEFINERIDDLCRD